MNILIFNGSEPLPKQGGMERVTDLLARLLLGKGHNVIFLCRLKNRIGEKYNSPVPIYYLPNTTKNDCITNQEFFLEVVKNSKIDIIIDQAQGEIVGRYGIFKKRSHSIFDKIKLVCVLHNSALSFLNNIKIILDKNHSFFIYKIIYSLFIHAKRINGYRVNRSLYREFTTNYDGVVVLSKSLFDEVKYFSPNVSENKLFAIPNPNTYLNPRTNILKNKEILFVGRMDNNAKGIDRLLKIWQKISPLCPDWRLTLVGDGKDKKMLEQMAKEMKLERYRFEGYQNPTVFYERASVFCMTSTFEGFGMVLTEAMQHGCVPIAFDSYLTAKDIIADNENGFLIPPFDLDQYADRLFSLIKDSMLLNEFADKAMITTEKFSTTNILKQWDDLFNEIIERG